MKTLRRKILIRKYDFDKLNWSKDNLYDRAEFLPVTKDDLEKQKIIDVLTARKGIEWASVHLPAVALYDLKRFLYDERYYDWGLTYDQEGYLCVQSKSNCPKSQIGWGIFEKDY